MAPNTSFYGTVFKLRPPEGSGHGRWDLTRLFRFDGTRQGFMPEGALLEAGAGVLYGTTTGGGKFQNGVVYSLTPPQNGQTKWAENILFDFPDRTVSGAPFDGLVADASGNLYGTASGSPFLESIIFRLTPPASGQTRWTETTLQTLSSKRGALAVGGLTQDGSGGFYGETEGGGPGGSGEVYHLLPPASGQTAGTLDIIYGFPAPDGSANPLGEVLRATDGTLFGTTFDGSTGGVGSVFSVSP